MFVDLLGALGFSDGPFRAALFVAARSAVQFPKELQGEHPRTRMRFHGHSSPSALQYGLGLFVAGSDLQAHHLLSSAGSFLEQFKDTGRQLTRRFQTRSRLQQRFSPLGQPLPGYRGFELPGNWRGCLLASGPWFSWFYGLGRSLGNDDEKKMAMASFDGKSSSSPGDGRSNKRFWTNVLIGLNVLVFVAQEASHGKLLLWGAKVNSLIDRGQLWRLITPALLHANLGHLLINCYSLNSVGPSVEALGGPRRFLAVYTVSAVTGLTLSYLFSKAPAVGASGAIFGLVGSLAVFFLRHKHLVGGAQQSLSQIARVITVNLVLGLVSYNIDNWGHLGGLMGGAVTSWFLGPALSFQYVPREGRRVLVDQPPISYLLPKGRR